MKQEWIKMKNISEINIAQNGNIQQNVLLDERGKNLMAKFGIKCKYSNENQLPKSSVDQFDGSRIYDENEFLTSLLIRSHLMNPKFQQTCKNIFENENIIGVNSNLIKYTKGSVKLSDRCSVKARIRIDYFDHKWAKTSNILDFVRCSVVCNDIETFNTVINNFIKLVNTSKSDSIIKNVRIKNGFSNVSHDMELENYNCSDVKMNVLIEFNNMRLLKFNFY